MTRVAPPLLFLLLCAACRRSEPEPRRELRQEPPIAPVPLSGEPAPLATATAAAVTPSAPFILARGVRIVHAGAGSDAAREVRDERDRAKRDGRDLVVYVGAKWCEPCQAFHRAAQEGALDGEFPDLTLLEFDLDEDRDRLTRAGYVGDFIPLFALPALDGRASDRRFEGAIKGSGATAHITPRLRKLLGR